MHRRAIYARFADPNLSSVLRALGYPFEALDTANSLDGDCSLTDEPCVHVLPEVWAGQEQVWEEYFDEGKIDTVEGNASGFDVGLTLYMVKSEVLTN